jgi:hypothetical protein
MHKGHQNEGNEDILHSLFQDSMGVTTTFVVSR